MLGMVLCVATLHLVLGYALAVYLGYAPLGSTAAVATTTTIPIPFEEEIIIEGELNEPSKEMASTDDRADETTDELPVVEENTTEVEDKPEIVAPSTSAEAPSTSADAATLFEETARLLAASSDMRSCLANIANRLWDPSEENRIKQDELAQLMNSLSDVIQKLETEEPACLDPNDPHIQYAETVLAARKTFLQHLSTVMDRDNHAQANDDEAFRQTLRCALLDTHEAAYELDEAMADVHTKVWNETAGMADNDQGPLADVNRQLAGRLGVLRSLQEFLSTEGNARPLVVAMLDVDDCRRLNNEIGPTRCDRLLDHVAEIVKQTISNPCALGHLSGQRLVVLIPDKLPNAATEEIELARETIAKTVFTKGNLEQKITSTCAIAEATPDEGQEALFRRLAETLQEAKRYGRNRTFLHEGDYPAPVVPPHLDVESRVVELA